MKKTFLIIGLIFSIMFSFTIRVDAATQCWPKSDYQYNIGCPGGDPIDGYYIKNGECCEDFECEDVPQVYQIVQMIFNYVKIIVPLLLIVFVMLDLVKATMSGSADEMKKAQKSAMTRAGAAIVIFFLPSLINLILRFAGIYNGTCGVS